MTKEDIKHAVIAILIGALAQVAIAILQLTINWIQASIIHVVSAAASSTSYFALWKTHNSG